MTLPPIYPILDTKSLERKGLSLERAAEALLEGGAGILQIRHKEHWTRNLFEEARRVAGLCREHGVLLIVDDRSDIAALLGAGVHVGQDDLCPADARKVIGPDAVLGFSTHNAAQLSLAAGEPVTYVSIGPVFPTASKENPDPVLGLEQVRTCRALTTKPLVAIGGITRENARSVLAAGADSVAAISDLLPEPSTSESLRRRMEEWRQLGTK